MDNIEVNAKMFQKELERNHFLFVYDDTDGV